MTPNDRELPDAWQYGADGAAEDGVSFVAEGRAGGGNAVLRLGDGDEGRRWNAGRLGGRKYDIFIYYVAKEVEDYERIDKSLAQVLDDLAAR